MVLAGRGIAGIGAAGLLTVRAPFLAALLQSVHTIFRNLFLYLVFGIIDRSNSHVGHGFTQPEQSPTIDTVFALFGWFQCRASDRRVFGRS